MPISTLADATNLLICRDMEPVRVRNGWEVQGQLLNRAQLVQLARQLDGGDEPSKYGNKRVEYDGHSFHSIAEMEYYKTLKLQEDAGVISKLECQPRFLIVEPFRDWSGKRHEARYYVADFQYVRQGRTIVEDVKGKVTDLYTLKRALFLSQYRHLEFYEVDV